MFSIFTHVMKPVRDTNSQPGLPVRYVLFLVNFYCIFHLRQINFLLRIYFLQTLLKLNFFFIARPYQISRAILKRGFFIYPTGNHFKSVVRLKITFLGTIYIYIYLSMHILYSFRQRFFRNTFECDYLVASIYIFLGTVARHVLCHPPGAMVKRATKTC